MPYEWKTHTGSTRLVLWPHRSLPRRGFAAFILITSAMITLPLFQLLGAIVLWGVLPFLLIAVAGLWWGLEKSYRDADIREDLVIDASQVVLTRTNPNGDVQTWQCNRYWARVEMHPTGGRVPHYITLKGSDRQVEIGAFLSQDERVAVFPQIIDALRGTENNGISPPNG